MNFLKKHLKIILPIALIVGAVGISAILIKTAPKAEKKRPQKQAALVDTIALKAGTETVVLKLTGTVIPAEEITLRARVSGEVVKIHPEFMEGGLLQKGDAILNIDPVDFELALAQSESALQRATFEHKLELGRQDVARREWELLGFGDDASESEKELALRVPHLAASRAALEAAKATVEKSKLNLSRTTLRAAFNAVVLSRNVNIGSQASQQDVLATLAGTDRYWVQASVPADRLPWITIPGSVATLHTSSGATREGLVIKRLGNLEEKGRMARILIAVDDPLCLTSENPECTPLLLGQYVRVDVQGRELEQVYSIPRSALHENRLVWIAAPNSTLELREVDVRWRAEKSVLVSGNLSDGERLITTELTTPMQGLTLNTGKKNKPQNTQKSQNKAGD